MIPCGAWVAQSVKYPTLGLGSGHDLTVRGIEPHVGLHAGSGARLGFSLSGPTPIMLSLCLSVSLSLSLSLKINK